MRILTFSDIHFKKEFEDLEDVKELFTSFGKEISRINQQERVDALVITGDIAYSGDSRQYTAFFKLLSENLYGIPLYSIPGNHDVNWNELKAALSNNGYDELDRLFTIQPNIINDDLEGANSNFSKVFANYANFAEEQNPRREEKKFEYSYKHQTGYLYNEQESVVLFFINSAWYSFGPGVIDAFYKDKYSKENNSATLFKELAPYMTGKLSQEGKQSYFLTFNKYYEKVLDLKKNKKCRVIAFAHHPLSWLKWDELYKKSKPGQNYRNIDKFMMLADVLITGHIHNPVLAPSYLHDKIYHLNNGAFMEYNHIENNKSPSARFPNSWFNLIDIQGNGFTVESYKLKTTESADKMEDYTFEWKMKNEDPGKCYPFKRKTVEERGLFSNDGRQLKNGSNPEFVSLVKVTDLTKLIRKKRMNEVEITSSPKMLNASEVYEGKLNGEDYIFVINHLDKLNDSVQESLKPGGDLQVLLEKDNAFTTILEKLRSKEGRYPVIALYDIVRFAERSDAEDSNISETYEEFNNAQFIKYQSFKHYFFVHLPAGHDFRELEIVYDLFLEN